ncbi:glycosyltransferase [Kaistia terrae]|uniref:Glycosyltransferase n=1 Tax=Kaistia terrae TaxID=537017 RepID=A0ABW0PT38_9HYPH|nr:glycosyltransferase family 2 protein [Kaistia terrae]MCX5577475.1 glycosyltransferase family 2 protein [Kaistia terrae]
MLEIVPLSSRDNQAEAIRSIKLASDVSLVVWDLPGPCAVPPRCARQDGEIIAPLASLRLGRVDGGTRILWALRPRIPLRLVVSAGTLGPSDRIDVDPADPFIGSDITSLVEDLDGRARVSLLTAFLTSWCGAFRLSRSPAFAEVVQLLAAELQPGNAQAMVACQPTRDTTLIEFATSADLGAIASAHLVTAQGVRRLACEVYARKPDRSGRRGLVLLVEGDATAFPSGTLVLIGEHGTAIRALGKSAKGPAGFLRWWGTRRGDGALTEFLVRSLSVKSEEARLAVIDMQARAAMPPKAAELAAFQPGAEVDLALSLDGGLLVGGWFRDPQGLIAGIDHVAAEATRSLDKVWHLFPGRVGTDEGTGGHDATGFIAYLPHDKPAGPILQPRFRLRLKTGGEISLIPKLQPIDAATMRAGALRSVPLQHATGSLLSTTLGPALAEIQGRVVKSVAVAKVERFGPVLDEPLFSIVIPLYRVLDYLRFQVAAFATDPGLRDQTEVIFVLDSPEQADDVSHMLGGLYRLYKMPMTLVVMSANGGYARANNAGVELARGLIVNLLNSDVIPTEHNWLGKLADKLGGSPSVGAVGPKLLFEDGSLQHAGLYFQRDARGTWLNHHFFKGMPGGHLPANRARLVPAVTGACLVMLRETFSAIGGFSEDYVIGDYEDSDICLKIREAGQSVAYEPGVALYHLERRSMRRNGDYMRGIASRYNSWLHTQRWDGVIGTLMDKEAAPSELPKAVEMTHRRSAA